MPEDAVLFEKIGAVAHIRLNRPTVHNALSPESIRLLSAIWQQIALDRGVRCAVLSGTGASFCAGMDLRQTDPGFGTRGTGTEDDAHAARPAEPRRVQYVPPPSLRVPLVAAIHGVALGGGLELALACDVRVAARGSRFGLPEAKRGLVPGSGGMFWLPRVIGWGSAMEMMLTGRIIGDEEALSLRLVNRLVDADELAGAALGVAEEIAGNAPLAVQAIKETAWRTVGAGAEEAMAVSEHQIRVLRLTRDQEEGARAFAEGRAPRFQGS
jgi:enoyl-CoA hydratase/carnithine racemase